MPGGGTLPDSRKADGCSAPAVGGMIIGDGTDWKADCCDVVASEQCAGRRDAVGRHRSDATLPKTSLVGRPVAR